LGGLNEKLILLLFNHFYRFFIYRKTSDSHSNDKFQSGFSFGVFMVKALIKDSYNSIILTGKYISESDLDWTVVRLPMLSDKPASGKINAGYTGDGIVRLFSLSRADLADFLLQQIDDKKWLHKSL
jgi:hypothetical protein